MLQAELDHIKLQFSHRADDLPVTRLLDEQLRDAFFGELLDAFFQLLGAERVPVFQLAEDLGRKIGNALVMQFFSFGQGIADLEDVVVVESDHIAGIGFFDERFFVRHEAGRVGKADFLVEPCVPVEGVALEFSGADTQEGDPVAMVRVQVRVDLEYEAAEFLLGRGDFPFHRRAGTRTRCDLEKRFQEFLHTEVVDRASEEHGSEQSIAIKAGIEGFEDAFHQLHVFPQFVGEFFSDQFVELFIAEVRDLRLAFADARLVRFEEVEFFPVEVVNPLEAFTLADRPAQRPDMDVQFLL